MSGYFRFDNKLKKQFKVRFAGIDEVGMGPLAGPVVAAAVILPEKINIKGVRDSKLLSERRREILSVEIKKKALCFGIGIIDNRVIDSINIRNACFKAMSIAVKGLPVKPDLLLVDGNSKIPGIDIPQKPIISGDRKSASIACASIIAKVTRDRIMRDIDKKYPVYSFKRNKGYGTKYHISALKKFGKCAIHRNSFCKGILEC